MNDFKNDDHAGIIARAKYWAENILANEHRGLGDTIDAAFHRAARKTGVPEEWFKRLRYRTAGMKDVPATIYVNLQREYDALRDQIDAQVSHEKKVNELQRSQHQMKVGFIGLGNVGGKLAGSLLRNGFDTTVRDLDKSVAQPFLDQGAHWANSPKEMAENCDLVITCLPSPAACAAVMEAEDGILAGMSGGKIWAEMSTTDVEEVKRLAKLVEAKGGSAIECPVSGGCHRAATGNISIFAGCERETFDRMLPLLTTLGRRVLHTGEIGSASMLKVMTNYLATANLITLSEAMVTMKAAGMDMATTYEAITTSSGTSFVAETEGQVILNGSRDISFTMDLVSKDIGLFQEIAERHNVPLEISPLMVDIFKDGEAKYGPRELSPNIIKRLEDQMGFEVLADGFPDEMTDDEPEEKGYEVVPKNRKTNA